jgi:hypothetical protein
LAEEHMSTQGPEEWDILFCTNIRGLTVVQ